MEAKELKLRALALAKIMFERTDEDKRFISHTDLKRSYSDKFKFEGSKYEPLWKWVKENGTDSFGLCSGL